MAKRAHTNESKAPVEIWYSRCGAATASALAIRKGWLAAEFDRPGTVLRSLRDDDSRAIRDAHYHHGQSGLFREAGNIPPIWARANGQDTVVVGITWLDEYQGILSRADGPIRSVEDLVGKRLALPLHDNLIDFQRGAALHGFTTALGLVGKSVDDVTLVDVRAGADELGRGGPRRSVEVEALLDGRVDAIFLRFARGVRTAADPRFHQVININELEDPLLRVNNGTPRPVTVDRRFLDQHPELVVRYLHVLLRTAAWAEQHPDEVLALLAEDAADRDVGAVVASHGAQVHRSFVPKLSAEYVRGLELQKDFLWKAGFLKADFDVSSWIVGEPLVEAQRLFARSPELSTVPFANVPTHGPAGASATT
jgi:ABC-type nitrate/sulfonate/bicarbonate transport system substrate-binding protein